MLLLAGLLGAALLALGGDSTAAAKSARAAQDGGGQAAYPWRRRVASAARYAKSRSGRVSFAVIDESGRLRGYHTRARYYSASVVKAMLMVAYLNRPSVHRRDLKAGDRALLVPMITRSDNGTATRVRNIVGNSGLAALARRVGMQDFATAYPWGNTRITPADQALFFLKIDRYVPRRHRAYARQLLSSIIPAQRWGMPPVSPPGWRIFFKGGWRPLGGRILVNQIALFENGQRRISVAVLTDGNPSYGYGHETIRGAASRLLLRLR